MSARIIRTSLDCAPVPDRRFDWSASFDGYEPGEPIGRGATEPEAIAELLLESDYMGSVKILRRGVTT